MAEIGDLQARLRPVGPLELLEAFAHAAESPDRPIEWQPPLMQIQMRSGASLRGYLVGAAPLQEGEVSRAFVMKVERRSPTHLGCDLAYVSGAEIEAVLLFDVDDILSTLPSR